jgi:undecaprenyl-diphosphatase
MADFMNNVFGGFDKAIAQFYNLLATNAGDFFTPLAKVITFLGEKGIIFFLLGAVLLLFKNTRKAGICMIGAVGLGAILSNLILKNLIQRPRPFNELPYSVWWVDAGSAIDDGFSCPSGHVTGIACALLSLVLTRGKKHLITAGVGITAMGWARNYLMVHYASDVIASVIVSVVAVVVAYLITLWILKICEKYKDKKIFALVLNWDVRDLKKKDKENV